MRIRGVGWVAVAAMFAMQTVSLAGQGMSGQAMTGQSAATQAVEGQAGQAVGPRVPGMAESAVIPLPAGTRIPLTLVSVIKSKTTRVGDSVRAQVAFPVTVGSVVAIPAGSYVEGMVTRLVTASRRQRDLDVEIHFTRLLFANGYAVPLDATSDQAQLGTGEGSTRDGETVAESEDGAVQEGGQDAEGFGFVGQSPTLPPLPHVGPSPALIGGIAAGGMGLLVGGLVWGHHRAGMQDMVLRDAGWQFAMVTQSVLALDAGQVKAAVGMGN
jgi:hypothetical protein